MPIRFGSDGFRGVIGAEFTRDGVLRIAHAVAEYNLAHGGAGRRIPVGYDTRFLSREYAQLCAAVLAQHGLRPLLSDRPCPSPVLSFMAHREQSPVALQITASHNPYFYNGVKLKAHYGGSLEGEAVAEIEARANALPEPVMPAYDQAALECADFREPYFAAMARFAEGLAGQRVIVDCMHGATAGWYDEALRRAGVEVEVLRADVDPLFGMGRPEPLEPLLGALVQRVREANAGIPADDWRGQAIGLAFDGDGDRLAVVDETGAYLPSHTIFALLLEQAVASGMPGSRVVTTVSFSSLPARVAAAHGLAVTEVPVGFKHVAKQMLKGDVLLGGEESGGAAFGAHLPERDALLMALQILALRRDRQGLTSAQTRLATAHGGSAFRHLDIPLAAEQSIPLKGRLNDAFAELRKLGPDAVASRSARDGVKLFTEKGWLLVRVSGTEPLARFYAEADTVVRAEQYIAAGRAALGLG